MGKTAEPQGKQIKDIIVFCASRMGKNPVYAEAAAQLGTLIGTHKFSMTYGGGASGLMGVTSRAARQAGAKVHGIITYDFKEAANYESVEGVHERMVKKLDTRKLKMISKGDLVIALPGGFGSFDEMFTTAALIDMKISARSEEYLPSIIIVNTNHYYDDMIRQIDKAVAEGFIWPGREKIIVAVDTPEEAIQKTIQWNREGILRPCDIPEHMERKRQAAIAVGLSPQHP